MYANQGRLSERLASLRDSKSYLFLGKDDKNTTVTTIDATSSSNGGNLTRGRNGRRRRRRSSNKNSNQHPMDVANKPNLVRDDLLIFELIFHSELTQEDCNGGNSNIFDSENRRKSTIKNPSDYSIRYHNWTLRQLYRHVVSSIKIKNKINRSSNNCNNENTFHATSPSPIGAAAGIGGTPNPRGRTQSISMLGTVLPLNVHPTSNANWTPTASAFDREYPHRPNYFHTNHHHPKLLGSNLHPRDMRRLVTPFSASNDPELIVRRHVMVLNFDPLRAIITRDRVLVLVPDGADSLLKTLEERIAGTGTWYHDSDSENWNENEKRYHLKYSDDSDNTDDESDLEAGGSEVQGGSEDHKRNGLKGKIDVVVDDDDDDWSEMMMMEDQRDDLTFELLCVNACLSTVFEMLAEDTRELQDKGLRYVQDRIIGERGRYGSSSSSGTTTATISKHQQLRPEDALAVIRNLKNAVTVMQARSKSFVQSINRILNEDEDMALMNLSRLVTHPQNFVQPVSRDLLEIESDEPELVLESNLHNALTLSNALDLIQGQVDTASDLVDARMDAARNQFLLASLCMSIASLSLTALSCVGGIFGMNLVSGMEEVQGLFFSVTYGSIAGSLVLGVAIFATMVRTGVITGLGPVDREGVDSLF